MNIDGKVAIVTGGASGLGEGTVRRYVEKGARVAIFDLNEERGKALVKELGDTTLYFNVNVTDELAVKAALDATVQAFGAVHICNNYAGIGPPSKTVSKGEPMALEFFQKIININLIGTFNVLRLVAAQMSKQEPVDADGQRGVIINTSSVAAYEGQTGHAAYSASKAGIVGMTLPIARDLSTIGIRVNTIVPGLIFTPLVNMLPSAAVESLSSNPLYPKRLGRPDEVAHLSQYIVENDYTNGECIRVDGGIRLPATSFWDNSFSVPIHPWRAALP